MKTKTGVINSTKLKEKKKPKKTKKAKTKTKTCGKYLKFRCPICFNNIYNEAVSSTHCGHVFCTSCLQKSLLLKPICPTCRKSLRKATAYHALYLNDNIYEEDQDIESS